MGLDLLTATLAWDKGQGLCESGDVPDGLLWMGRALELAPTKAERVRNSLVFDVGSWINETHILHAVLDHPAAVHSAVISPTGHFVVTGSADFYVRVRKTATGALLHETSGHAASVGSRCFHPSGTSFVSASTDGTIRFWDPETGHPTGAILNHHGQLRSVGLTSESEELLSVGLNGVVKLWNVQTGAVTTECATGMSVDAVAISPAEPRLAIASHTDQFQGGLTIWDLDSGRVRDERMTDELFRTLLDQLMTGAKRVADVDFTKPAQKGRKRSALADIFGKWPGDETDEQVRRALEELD
jgi:WD40 repeat protein